MLEVVVLPAWIVAHASLDLRVRRELVMVLEKLLKCIVRQLALEGLPVLLLTLFLDVTALVFGPALSFWCILSWVSSCILACGYLILTYLDWMSTVVTIQRYQ